MNTTVYCYDRYATHKRIAAALLLGAGAMTLGVNIFAKPAPAVVHQLPRVVVTGKAVVQLPRVVVNGKSVQAEHLLARVDF